MERPRFLNVAQASSLAILAFVRDAAADVAPPTRGAVQHTLSVPSFVLLMLVTLVAGAHWSAVLHRRR